MSNENKKWYEEEIEKTREKLQSRWKRQGETKVKFKIEPYVFDYDWSEYSVDDKKLKKILQKSYLIGKRKVKVFQSWLSFVVSKWFCIRVDIQMVSILNII